MPWILRKVANNLITLKMRTSHDVDETGLRRFYLTHMAWISIAQLSEETEIRYLDGREEFHTSGLFGVASAQARLINPSPSAKGKDGKPLDPFLIDGFLKEGEPGAANNLYDLIIHQSKGWSMEQVWGFGIVQDSRRLLRKIIMRKGDEASYMSIWYDWCR